jgi:hypothetical protein
MKLTRRQLRSLIRENVQTVLSPQGDKLTWYGQSDEDCEKWKDDDKGTCEHGQCSGYCLQCTGTTFDGDGGGQRRSGQQCGPQTAEEAIIGWKQQYRWDPKTKDTWADRKKKRADAVKSAPPWFKDTSEAFGWTIEQVKRRAARYAKYIHGGNQSVSDHRRGPGKVIHWIKNWDPVNGGTPKIYVFHKDGVGMSGVGNLRDIPNDAEVYLQRKDPRYYGPDGADTAVSRSGSRVQPARKLKRVDIRPTRE